MYDSIEQSIEWNSSLYVNFIDFEKAFDSLDREILWKNEVPGWYYGIPTKLITLIKNMYSGMKCQVIHGGDTSAEFEIKTGVRQGCLLSPFLFLLAIDWMMRESVREGKEMESSGTL